MNQPKSFLLSVGVSAYSRLSPLRCSAADATDIAAVFASGGSPSQQQTLVDAVATREAILAGLAWLAGTAGSNDTVGFYFSGHGLHQGNEAYLCPVEASLGAIDAMCIEAAELTTALRKIRSARLLVLLDACHSGALGDPRGRGGALRSGLPATRLASLVTGEGRVVLAASRPDQAAWELGGMRNGLFTHYVLEGLRGDTARSDRTVWVSDLFSYVSRHVRRHGCQIPYQNAIGEDFVVLTAGQDKGRRAEQNEILAPPSRRLRGLMHRLYDRNELALLCHDLGFRLEDLWGTTLETQILALIDHCQRHGRYQDLIMQVAADRPSAQQELTAPAGW